MWIKNLMSVIVISISVISCNGKQEMANTEFTESLLLGPTGALFARNMNLVSGLEIYEVKDLKGVISRDVLMQKAVKKFTISQKSSKSFFEKISAISSNKLSCKSAKEKPRSFHVIIIGDSDCKIGYLEIRESSNCQNIGFVKTPASLREISNFKLLVDYLEDLHMENFDGHVRRTH